MFSAVETSAEHRAPFHRAQAFLSEVTGPDSSFYTRLVYLQTPSYRSQAVSAK